MRTPNEEEFRLADIAGMNMTREHVANLFVAYGDERASAASAARDRRIAELEGALRDWESHTNHVSTHLSPSAHATKLKARALLREGDEGKGQAEGGNPERGGA